MAATDAADVINPRLAGTGLYTAIMIIGIYWLAVLLSSRGMKAVAGIASGRVARMARISVRSRSLKRSVARRIPLSSAL